ncbi:MAG: NAD-dependent epimerase/dehydratase family protein [Pseudonocardiaceae bacterium]|nr:NAD-dependent epimerase/dehydratase family protein [Pseudonocardiaceae bacterium]
MRVLVTGATGFLARAVVPALTDAGHEVVALIRAPAATVPGAHSTVLGDLGDGTGLASALPDVDGVCHLAAVARVRDSLADPLRYWRVNAAGTLALLEALSRQPRPPAVVLASTCAVYGTPERQPITEAAPTCPANPYGASKLAADHMAAGLAATGAIGAISLRALNLAGSAAGTADRDTTRLIPKIVATLRGRAPELHVNGDGSAVRDYLHVDDMTDAVCLALAACKPGQWTPYNVGSGRGASIRALLTTAAEVTGQAVPVTHGPAASEPRELVADNSRIRAELGWTPSRSELATIVTDAWKAR